MADLTVTEAPVDEGVTIAAVAAAAGGDTAPVGPNRFLYLANGDASAHTATIATPGTVAGLAVADATLTVAAGAVGIIPLTDVFKGANSRAVITYDAVTSVTVAVLELARS